MPAAKPKLLPEVRISTSRSPKLAQRFGSARPGETLSPLRRTTSLNAIEPVWVSPTVFSFSETIDMAGGEVYRLTAAQSSVPQMDITGGEVVIERLG